MNCCYCLLLRLLVARVAVHLHHFVRVKGAVAGAQLHAAVRAAGHPDLNCNTAGEGGRGVCVCVCVQGGGHVCVRSGGREQGWQERGESERCAPPPSCCVQRSQQVPKPLILLRHLKPSLKPVYCYTKPVQLLTLFMELQLPPAEVCLTDLAWDYPGV